MMILGIGLEMLLRHGGYSPIVVNDSIAWCQRRASLEKESSQKQIVILGPSFAETDLLVSVMQEELPRCHFTKLALGGTGCYRVLEDIAIHSRFRGLVLCAMTPDYFLPQDVPGIRQYHNIKANPGRYEQFLNRKIKTWIQNRLVLAIPPYKEVFRSIREKNVFPRTLQFFANGDVWVNYQEQSAQFKQSISAPPRRKYSSPEIAPVDQLAWEDAFSSYRRFAERIRSRGGEVVFFIPPTHPIRWAYYQRQYPRDQYLGKIPEKTGAQMIHFADFPETAAMESYDFDHLEKPDAVIFTHVVLKELRKRNLLPKDSSQ